MLAPVEPRLNCADSKVLRDRPVVTFLPDESISCIVLSSSSQRLEDSFAVKLQQKWNDRITNFNGTKAFQHEHTRSEVERADDRQHWRVHPDL